MSDSDGLIAPWRSLRPFIQLILTFHLFLLRGRVALLVGQMLQVDAFRLVSVGPDLSSRSLKELLLLSLIDKDVGLQSFPLICNLKEYSSGCDL